MRRRRRHSVKYAELTAQQFKKEVLLAVAGACAFLIALTLFLLLIGVTF
jgi:hypothetical protein